MLWSFSRKNNDIKLVDSHILETKTEWPDLTVKIVWPAGKSEIFFEMKAADSSKDPANDLGTLRSLWKEHILEHLGLANLDVLFMVFVRYSKGNGQIQSIDRVYIAHYFKFIGTRTTDSVQMLKYRKKDGNTRPKIWEEIGKIESKFLTEEELASFLEKYYLSIIFRSIDIIKEHDEILHTFSDTKTALARQFRVDKLGLDIEKLSAKIEPKADRIMKKLKKKQSKIENF